MQLFIKPLNSKIITLNNINTNDCIGDLKQQIYDKCGIPCSIQKLKYSTYFLSDNNKTLNECNVLNNSTLLVSMGLNGGVKINVKPIGKGSIFSLELEGSDTIENLKLKIQEEHGISPQNIRLTYRGKCLSNDNILENSIKILQSKGQATILMKQHKTAEEVKPVEKEPEPAVLCINNCGFYGSSSNKGYCSSCYKKLNIPEENKPVEEKKEKIIETPEVEPDIKQKDFTHCWKCNKRVGLLGFACKCKYIFCAEHRYSEKHDCTFDYQGKGQQALSANLPKVQDKKGLYN